MVALALGSIILMMVANVFSGASRVFSATDKTSEAYTNVRIVLDIMQEQLNSVCPEWLERPTAPVPVGEPTVSLRGIHGTDGTVDANKDTLQIRVANTSGAVEIVEYQIDDSDSLAWRFLRPHGAGDPWTFATTFRGILRNVDTFNVEYWDSRADPPDWVDEWSYDDHPNMPPSIRVTITVSDVIPTADGEPGDVSFTRVLRLPVVPE